MMSQLGHLKGSSLKSSLRKKEVGEAYNECNDIQRSEEMIRGKRVRFKDKEAPNTPGKPRCLEEDFKLC
ncbi:unnamed protein product [Paramecium octaurelia]|uniref:Uncharacterized protein n=1 Tax=Paramecium octaurelia TaxID=43137 RepID=A0A8S1YLW9_PAROT|nr:unnamed protein product [Paramecium octaurelia]